MSVFQFGWHDRLWFYVASCVVFYFFSAASILVLAILARSRLRQVTLWKLPGPPSVSIITGNFTQMFDFDARRFHERLRKSYGRVIRIAGLLGDSHLVISDTRAVYNILVKEHAAFETPEWLLASNARNFGLSLLSIKGPIHRKQRKLLHPVFSVEHLRSLAPLFHKVTQGLVANLQETVSEGPKDINILASLEYLALELIAQGGLGYTFDSFRPDREENEFDTAIKEYMPTVARLHVLRMLAHWIPNWPPSVLRLVANILPIPALHNLMRISGTIDKYTTAIFDEKKALFNKGDDEFTHQLSEGKDIISVLMRQNLTAPREDQLSDAEIKGQMATFIFAATETTSSALARILSLLADHQDVQDRLRQEIYHARESAGGKELEYEELDKLPYLDAVCHETLRAHSPATYIPKSCREDIVLPLAHPVLTSDGPISTLFVPRGTSVLVDVTGINRDPTIWGADADEWKPERFLSPLPDSVGGAQIPGVYSNIVSFGAGARSCIGFKFALLEMKITLSYLVGSFRFLPSKTEIVWRYGGITTPAVKGSNAVGTAMPMVVESI
ncbi:cytochrome P450 [Artomyces pyxidatus]|uniref:Cytochrome P450 n=1 Tax=Artomyces pyxidatus TaxID=48021 RepID=A0ACB8SQP4_9AGAM|nr:cytochrome P450 [Artomyces pyxidatus]